MASRASGGGGAGCGVERKIRPFFARVFSAAGDPGTGCCDVDCILYVYIRDSFAKFAFRNFTGNELIYTAVFISKSKKPDKIENYCHVHSRTFGL